MVPETIQTHGAEGHLLFSSGDLLWCWKCGRYSLMRTHGLGTACKGLPGTGQGYRLKRLKNGRHPITNRPFAVRATRLLA